MAPATPANAAQPGVRDLYVAIGRELRERVRPRHAAIALEAVLIAAYVLLRTADAGRDPKELWLAAALVLTAVSPVSGLVVLAAIAPYREMLSVLGPLGVKPILALGVLASAVGWLLLRRVRGPALPPVLAGAGLALALVPGLFVTQAAFGPAFAASAAGVWLQGIATALVTFLAATLVALGGERRALWVAVGSAIVAALVSLVDHADPTLRASALDWLLDPTRSPPRLTGVTGSAVSTAALVMIPLMLVVPAVVGRVRRPVRVVALLLAVPLLVAAFLTFNRALYLAIFAATVIVTWRWRPRVGLVLLVVGLVGLAIATPFYLRFRAETVGGVAQPRPGEVLIASDVQRLEAWRTSLAMVPAAPLTGHGYRSFRELHDDYGTGVLDAPHNEWLRILAEHGVLVALVALAWLVAVWRALLRVPGALGAGVLAAFASFVIAASVNNPFLFHQVTVIAFTVIGTGVALGLRAGDARVAVPATTASPAPADEPGPPPHDPAGR